MLGKRGVQKEPLQRALDAGTKIYARQSSWLKRQIPHCTLCKIVSKCIASFYPKEHDMLGICVAFVRSCQLRQVDPASAVASCSALQRVAYWGVYCCCHQSRLPQMLNLIILLLTGTTLGYLAPKPSKEEKAAEPTPPAEEQPAAEAMVASPAPA
jgi:hypothetical protein